MYYRHAAQVVAAVVATGASVAHGGELVAVSFPESVALSQSTTASGPRSVAAPFDFSGIGNVINPSVALPGSGANANDFALHQTIGVVDLADVVVTYEFDTPVLVDAFDIVQHHNGVETLELFVGDSLMSMTSMGTVSVPENTIEFAVNRFDFDVSEFGRFVQLRVTKAELPGQGGWAMYRAYPILVPAPATFGIACFGVVTAATRRRRV